MMKNNLKILNNYYFPQLLLVVFCLFLFSTKTLSSPPQYGKWQLLPELSDDFSLGSLDKKKWQNHSPYWGGKAPGLHSSDSTMVWKDELLLITQDESSNQRRRIRTAFFKSKQPVKYGYLEIKAKAMPSKAAAGFFLYRYTKNATYEIDIVEIGAGAPGHENVHHSNAHVYYGDPELENDQNRISSPQSWRHSEPLSNNYHHYALEWDELELRWYFDGKLIRRKINEHWRLPMFIHITTEIVSDWFGVPEKQELPQAFHVDYIKVWKRVDISPSSQP